MVTPRYSTRCMNPDCAFRWVVIPVDAAYAAELARGEILCGVCGQPTPADTTIPAPPEVNPT